MLWADRESCLLTFPCEVQIMKIIVCDDVKEDREELRQKVEKIWPHTQVEEISSGEELLGNIRRGESYDLIFLDIYMDSVSGIDAGKWIHDNFPEMNMVFVSSSRDFGPELFQINAMHYLVKPYGLEELKEVKRRLLQRREKDAVIRLDGREKEEIPFQRITYIESSHNNLEIHFFSGGMITVRDSIRNFMEKLDDRFLRINRGVVVNMDAVEKMNSDSCEIAGLTFMLSRKTRHESRKKYNDFLFQRAMG